MPVIVPLLLVSLILAGVAGAQSRRQSRFGAHPTLLRPPVDGRHEQTLVRRGHVGDLELGEPVRASTAIAPLRSSTVALEFLTNDGSVIADVNVGDAVMVRAWSMGHLVLAFGAPRRAYGPSWALGPAMVGWEIQLVTTSGDVLRCYGRPGVSADADLGRLRDRLEGATLAQAS